MTKRIAVFGAGVMGEALLSGLLRSGVGTDRLMITERRPDRAKELAERYGVDVVDNIEAARADLVSKGATVSEPFHFDGILGPLLPGLDPQRSSYGSYAEFKDPDGNGWLLQEVKARLPGRGLSLDVATLTELLRETEEHHGQYEPTAPKHHWSGFYAAYIVACERGSTPEDAASEARRHVEAELARAQA